MNDNHYFNLLISGVGYLNRVRNVIPKKGEPFLCCDIAALRGEVTEAGHTRFDCRVSGKEAQKLVLRCMNAFEQKRKVLIQFRLGDLYAETFTWSKGERKGETGVSLKAHLLHIGLIKIDGKEVYRAERTDTDLPSAPDTPEAENKSQSAQVQTLPEVESQF